MNMRFNISGDGNRGHMVVRGHNRNTRMDSCAVRNAVCVRYDYRWLRL